MAEDLPTLEVAFYQVHDWLEGDRDRRVMKIYADNYELWYVSLLIDEHVVAAERGYVLVEVIAEAMRGLVMPEVEPLSVPAQEDEES